MIVQENIPSYIKSAMQLMYHTAGGRYTATKTQALLKK